MTVVVAQALDTEDRGALHAGGMLARSLGSDLVVCGVLPHRWTATIPGRDDATRTARESAATFLAGVHRTLPDDVVATDHVAVARSVPAALHEVVREREAGLLVLGSSEDGVRGRVSVGSVADRVLHSAPVPVVVAPRGFTAAGDARVTRVTVAVDSGPSSVDVLAAGARLAHRAGASVRMVTFAIRRKAMFPPELGFGIEESVLDVWKEQARDGQRAAAAALASRPDADVLAPVDGPLVATGRTWEHAVAELDWVAGDVLVMGSSSESALSKVFLGSTAARLLRAATVPTVVTPRVSRAG